MIEVSISEAKARLSAYLRRVREGETVIIYDRQTPVARLVPFEENLIGLQIREPTGPKVDIRTFKGVKPKHDIDVVALLREDRDAK